MAVNGSKSEVMWCNTSDGQGDLRVSMGGEELEEVKRLTFLGEWKDGNGGEPQVAMRCSEVELGIGRGKCSHYRLP